MKKEEMRKEVEIERPDKLSSYFKEEIGPLFLVTITGIIYNIGLTAGPFFEGQLAGRLFDIMAGKKTRKDMIFLALLYMMVVLMVQGARALKRFYVRRFANDTSRNMRHILYNKLLFSTKRRLQEEEAGTLMTKAISDVDACTEGMRKFTTEVFDTGIALLAYLGMLFLYDWRLAFMSCLFTPIAYVLAEKLKILIYRYNSAYKKSAGALSGATLDRINGSITYRVFGREEAQNDRYEGYLQDYEKKAVLANIWENTPQPMYNVISMTGVILIIYFGGKNVLGTGWTQWDIASFATFIACFGKMAMKSSKAAKLFNAVQKAQVSWKRIKPLMQSCVSLNQETSIDFDKPKELQMRDVSFCYPDDKKEILCKLNIVVKPGELIGITGPVACGKSTLGKLFLQENPYHGTISIGGVELSALSDYERGKIVSYLGHQPELLSDTIAENISLGNTQSVLPFLKLVCLNEEVETMPEKEKTFVGNGGVQLSGGQQARVALARTLYHKGNIIILDDPFSAVDHKTEQKIMTNLKEIAGDSIIILISHRVQLFEQCSQVIWMENGICQVGSHRELLGKVSGYQKIYEKQTRGGGLDEE